MLVYLKGSLSFKTSEWAVIEVGGIGYRVFMPASSLMNIANIGDEIKIYTHLQVKEDVLNLYGFGSDEELQFFEILIQVAGIGPKAALAIVGAFSLTVLQMAILEENISLLSKAPGVGKKTAQRIVLELKDKVSKLVVGTTPAWYADKEQTSFQDALLALETLGYGTEEAGKMLRIALNELGDQATTESIVKLGLKYFAGELG